MGKLIAISGKGGVGKSTLAGLCVKALIDAQQSPVLAVDADPNTCLDGVLGVSIEETVGRVREKARDAGGQGASAGISKQEWLSLKINESLVEQENFDYIAMGRSEGPGCYCYANNILKQVMQELSSQYPTVVLDNEAGLENLSRRLAQQIDVLVMVADPSRRGLETAKRLHDLTTEMEVAYQQLWLVVNRVRGERVPSYAEEVQQSIGAQQLLCLPDNEEIATVMEAGESIFSLSPDNPVYKKLVDVFTPALIV